MKYIRFEKMSDEPAVWAIVNKRAGDMLGFIEYHKQWKQFVANFENTSIWSADCLDGVASFLKNLE